MPSSAHPISHVFVIVMENKSYAQAMSGPYTASLANQYALATNYYAISHPSLPNYLALTSGRTWGIADDGYHALPACGIGQQLKSAGVLWRGYMESMNNSCFNSGYPYALKHNPFAYYGTYYGGSCPDIYSTAPLQSDLNGTTPWLVWITPNLCNDTHDCPVSTGDSWLSHMVPEITNSAAWQQNGVLFITWDEDNGAAGNHVATIIVAPNLTRHTTDQAYNHYSLLATAEDRLGVPRLASAAGATPINDVFR